MEPTQPRHNTFQFAPGDFISRMPDNVVTSILDRLPLQEAVRTDVLSKAWRFKWNMLTQLVFDEDFFEYLTQTEDQNNQVRVLVSRLLHLTGPITKCVIEVYAGLDVDDEDISHWIILLSRKGVKELTLKSRDYCFNLPPNFHGFPNLLSLELYVSGKNNELGEFITLCPLLENLKLSSSSNKVKVVEIAKLENLKRLSLYLCNVDTMKDFHSSSTIFELLGSLPKLEEFELNFINSMLENDDAQQRFSASFPSLKLSCAVELIRSCPNLRTLEIKARNAPFLPSPPVEYSTTEQLQLRSVMYEYVGFLENDVCLLKYVLASSPFLKKIVISPRWSDIPIASDEKLRFAKKLLKFHRASPIAEIDLS
ncbi:F-box/FBD/LRR-repeat protein At1g13570-like [Bidens hawaiensis]|uniref:F-box/FBD/LRR-repeat protein At1g13570-like n=1 Tax=Bidens hawaiensis TaxID=980011 RepID=UPI00404A38B3